MLGDIQQEKLEAVAASARSRGARVTARRCDVGVESDVAALVEEAVATFSGLDVAVNNAGVLTPMRRLIETDEADLDLAFRVNAKGVFFGLRYEIPVMLRQTRGGVILNVASMAGLRGAPRLGAYVAAKHAVVGLTKTAALEHARDGIRVNALCPFFTVTPMVTDSLLDSAQMSLAERVPMRRLGRPEEVVEAMMMLCARGNSFMTGQALAVDGGVSA